jgi:hypothetical protein
LPEKQELPQTLKHPFLNNEDPLDIKLYPVDAVELIPI